MDGIVELDTDFAKEIGFTSDLFDGYLWLKDVQVVISLITSKKPGEGNLSKLFARIEEKGLSVAVPTPFAKMKAILVKKGFSGHIKEDALFGPVELWTKY